MAGKKQKKYQEFLKKLHEEKTFFMNQFETVAVRSVPGIGYFVKFKGKKEIFVPKENSTVIDTIFEYHEITEEEYNNF